MGKVETSEKSKPMSDLRRVHRWDDKEWLSLDEKMGGGNIYLLRNDEESHTFLIMGQPFADEVKFRRGVRKVVVIPIVTVEGPGGLLIGQKTYRLLRALMPRVDDKAIVITRHGGKDEITTRYTFSLVPVNDELISVAMSVTPEQVTQAATTAYKAMADKPKDTV